MAKIARRIQRDIRSFIEAPPDFVPKLYVDDHCLSKIYFLVQGPTDTDFEGGEYVVVLELPDSYPLKPPDIKMLTPSGRFEVGRPICTTFTSFHPESWSPSYDFATIMRSFVSFMVDDPTHHVGGQKSTPAELRSFAKISAAFNISKGYAKWFAP